MFVSPVAAMVNFWLNLKNSTNWSISMTGVSGGKITQQKKKNF